MRRLVKSAPAGTWPEDEAEAGVTLAYEDRHRRRLRLTMDTGEPVLLDLPRAKPLAENDGLGFADGGWVRVRAAEEDVLDVRGHDAAHLARLAWHLGNRHMATQIAADGTLRIRYDHVIESMLRGLGAACERGRAPFQPEGGAYGGRHHHDHD
ncbi:MAG TPA: urease accessory protein UreE [Geminicoccaceae bacterium]|nr:urease accessory protein UreE [Geminicoccaceae bacterium]